MATNTDEREEIKPVAPTEQTKWRDPSLVGKYMVDPKTGLAGLFRSPDNGETWVLTDTVYGHVYNQDEVDNIWDNGAGHKVADEIKSATADLPNVRKQADEAVKFAESAVAASKVNSDAIVAQSSAVVEAKSAMDSATAEIQQLKANAASDVAQIRADVAEVQAGVNQAKSANESAIQAVQAELKSTSDAMDKVEKQLNEVGTSLDTYAKSAAEQGHDITVIKQKQGQFEADFASVQGNVNQIQADIKGLRQNIKDNQGNIATLLTSADKLQASMKDAQNNISNLLLTASEYEQTFKDQDGRLSKVEQTATEHTSELADAKGNLDKVTQKADSLEATLTDAQKDINSIKVDASGIHEALTGQGKQITTINATLDGLNTKYEGVSDDLSKLSGTVATNSTQIDQNKKSIALKADQATVDNLSGEVSRNTAQLKVQADQISSKVSSEDFSALDNKVDSAIAQIQKNSTAIDQTNQKISLKADQTEVDKIKNTATQNSSRLDVMAGEIQSKVTSTDVDNIINGKGYATTSTVQSLITQKAGTINESITSLDAKYNATVTQVQSLTASIDGLQSTVANKADKSQITQLSNVIQSKVSASDFNDLKDKTLWKSADSIDLNNAVSQQKIFVKGGSNLPPGDYWWYVQVESGYDSRIVQYAVSDRDNIHYSRQYDGKQWTAWSQGATESEITQLRDDINLRVKSGDLLSQINIQAGRTLIQSQKIYMDADSVIMGPNTRAFIPSAAIINIDADKITTGVLNGIDIHQIATKEGRSIDISGGNITLDSWDPYAPRLSFRYQGQMVKMFNASGDLEADTWGIFNFSPSDTQNLHPIQFFRINNVGGKGSGGARMQLDHAIFDGHEWWANSDGITFGRSYDGINGSNDYVELYAKSFLPHSQLSSKTRIEKLDGEDAMNTIKQVQMYTYQFKDDVRDGKTKRYASLIIDDVHDVAQYTEPDIFVADNKKSRDDGTQLAYAIAAIQYQQHEIEELKVQLKEKKANE